MEFTEFEEAQLYQNHINQQNRIKSLNALSFHNESFYSFFSDFSLSSVKHNTLKVKSELCSISQFLYTAYTDFKTQKESDPLISESDFIIDHLSFCFFHQFHYSPDLYPSHNPFSSQQSKKEFIHKVLSHYYKLSQTNKMSFFERLYRKLVL